MKLFIDGKHRQVGFWSLLKCILIVDCVIAGILWVGLAIMFGGIAGVLG